MRSIQSLLSRTGYVALAAVGLGLVPTAAQAQTPMSFFPVSPCRLWDTRNAPGPQGGPAHNANTTRDFAVRSVCGVPTTAQAAVLNLTVTFGTLTNRDFGNMRAFPAGGALPNSSVLNWAVSDPAVANGAIILLGDSGGNHISIRIDMPTGSPGQIHSLCDVTGYFQ